MTLAVAIRHRLGAFELDVDFESEGRLTALFGPSGSGKTSVVNAIAGLMRPDQGRIEADGRVLLDTAKRLFLPGHKRRIGYVFQDARLFRHMTVRQNLAYGRFFAPRAERYADEAGVIALLGIGHLLAPKPDRLSGGVKSRVAIGRALVASPKLILMDEPLASLDEPRKAEILPYIERLRDETNVPIVYVSHSVAEVARLATRVVLLAAGKVVSNGPPADVLQRLDLLPDEQIGEGGALLDMTVVGHDEQFGMTALASPAGEMRIPMIDVPAGTPIRLRIRARDVMIATQRPVGLSALNVMAGRIVALDPQGALVDIRLDCGGRTVVARLTRQSAHSLDLDVGRDVYAVVKTVSFDSASTTRRIRLDV